MPVPTLDQQRKNAKLGRDFVTNSPFKVDGLDDEPQGWADSVDVLVHDLLDNCRLAGIV